MPQWYEWGNKPSHRGNRKRNKTFKTESKGCAIAMIVGVGIVLVTISGLVYAVASVL